MTNSPTMGNLVLMMAIRAEKTGVNGKEEAWAFMIARAKSPRPRMRFSLNISGTTYLMFATLTYETTSKFKSRQCLFFDSLRETTPTLLIRPLILFLNASHVIRCHSTLLLSFSASFCIALNLLGGIYAPPLLVLTSLANSAAGSNSLFFATTLLGPSLFPACSSKSRSASCLSRSLRRKGSISTTLGRLIAGPAGAWAIGAPGLRAGASRSLYSSGDLERRR